ncbi:unnamed protein product, partial [Nesidiocoris tenuis]
MFSFSFSFSFLHVLAEPGPEEATKPPIHFTSPPQPADDREPEGHPCRLCVCHRSGAWLGDLGICFLKSATTTSLGRDRDGAGFLIMRAPFRIVLMCAKIIIFHIVYKL